MKLTKANIGKLPLPGDAGKSDIIYFDDAIPGFGLRIRNSSSGSWIYQYKLGSKQRRIVLGKATAITPDKARETAADLHAAVRLGRDPAADKVIGKAQASNSFGDVVDRYLAFQKEKVRPRSYIELVRYLNVYAKPWHGLPVTSIKRDAVANRLTDIARERGGVTANRCRGSWSAMFSWAMKQGVDVVNPVINTVTREETPRDRILSDAELVVIWNALEGNHFGNIIKLLVLTGCRASEITGLRWSEINFDRRLITLPPPRVKNKRTHLVPMSEMVSAILEAQSKTDGCDLVFGSGSGGPFSNWSKSKEALNERILKTAGKALPHWTPHDLRRTMSTRMHESPGDGGLGIQPHIVEACLNHLTGGVKSSIAGVYNHSAYLSEKTRAMALWADHIAAILEGRKSNVAQLRRSA
jgi:integrase